MWAVVRATGVRVTREQSVKGGVTKWGVRGVCRYAQCRGPQGGGLAGGRVVRPAVCAWWVPL